jgi:hypothetical protein
MKIIFKGAVLLFIFIMELLVMPVSNANAVDTELFVHKSPDFTLTIPKWVDQKSQDLNAILCRQPKLGSATTLEVAVHDLPAGMTYQDATLVFKKALEGPWKASNIKILYEREIKLKDNTQAYEFEVKWKSGIWPLRSYAVIVFKDKKIIEVVVTSSFWVGGNLKQYPLSLILK